MSLLIRLVVLFLGLMATSPVLAQGLDGHGAAPPPGGTEPADPLLSWHPVQPGALSLSLVGEYAAVPLVQTTLDGEDLVREVLLDRVVGANLGAVYGLRRGVGLGLSVPVWLGSGGSAGGGLAGGDAQLWLPLQARAGDYWGMLVPFASLPTGATERYLGDPTVGVGALAAGGLVRGAWSAGATLGLEQAIAEESPRAGTRLRLAADLGWLPRDDLALHLEGRLRSSLRGVTGHPGEIGLSARGRGAGWWWVLGGTVGVSDGAGAATGRAFAGIGIAPGSTSDDEVELEPVEEWVELRVLSPEGLPVRGSVVRQHHEALGSTDHRGVVELDPEIRWRDGVVVEAEGFTPAAVFQWPTEPLVLDWAPVPVAVRVVDQAGEVVAAQLRFDGPSSGPEPFPGPTGTQWYSLPPGAWRLRVEAEGLGAQERSIEIAPGRTTPIAVDVALAPVVAEGTQVVVQIRDPAGVPVEGAFVSVDSVPLGSTGPGGQLVVEGLAEGVAVLAVYADQLEGVAATELVIGTEVATVDVGLGWLPGSVRVRARGPDGPVRDATVRLRGPALLPPTSLGPGGERVFTLSPGQWTLLVSSPALGLQERELRVPAEPGPLLEVDVLLQPDEAGSADLLVRVTDPEGVPLDGAAISLDGLPVGATATGGSLLLRGLRLGTREVQVHAPPLDPFTAEVALVWDHHELDAVLGWAPGSVRVTARGSEGSPIDAAVRMSGPQEVPLTQLGPDGSHLFQLAPGRWDVLVSSPEHGLQFRSVDVPERGSTLTRVDAILVPPERGTHELVVRVVDPAGRPLSGAAVSLGGSALGTTANSGEIRVGGLAPGDRTVEVGAPGHRAASAEVVIPPEEGTTELPVQLEWAAGALAVQVLADGVPVSDAVVRVTGPRVLPFQRVDGDGRRTFALGPGEWRVLVSSTSSGMAQQDVVIAEDGEDLAELVFQLSPPPRGSAVLLVRVRDEELRAVAGAEIRLAGEWRGTTSAGGSFLATGLPTGPIALDVTPSGAHYPATEEVVLLEGSQERVVVLQWPRTEVVVRVTGEGAADARVGFQGVEILPEEPVDPWGEARFRLRPGLWLVHATAEGMAVDQQELLIEPGSPARQVELVLRPAEVVLDDGGLSVDDAVFFGFDQAELRPEAAEVLAEIASLLRTERSLVRLEIQGHTDNQGSLAYNLDLSRRRAQAVRDALVERGVAPEQLSTRGFGMLRPKAPNTTDEGRSQNRRVEFEVVEVVPGG